MRSLTSSALLLAAAGVAHVRAAPEPVITHAAILPRENQQTLGYFASGFSAGQTIYVPWVFDADSTTYTTSGNYFRRCAVSSTCTMFTSCSAGYLVAAGTTSSYCGISGATGGTETNYCSNHVIYPSLGAVTSASWFWCDSAPLTGITFFAKNPAPATITPPGSSRSASASATRSGSNSGVSNTASSPTVSSPTSSNTNPPATDNKESTPVGAIAGGVIGGVAVLGAIGFAIFFIMRRDKKKKEAQAAAPLMSPQTAYQPAGFPTQEGYYAAAGYPTEQKPQYYQQQPAQPYPMGPYDPHITGYGQTLPPQELGAPSNFPPQELPAQQRSPK